MTKNKHVKVPFLRENTPFLTADNIGRVADIIGRYIGIGRTLSTNEDANDQSEAVPPRTTGTFFPN